MHRMILSKAFSSRATKVRRNRRSIRKRTNNDMKAHTHHFREFRDLKTESSFNLYPLSHGAYSEQRTEKEKVPYGHSIIMFKWELQMHDMYIAHMCVSWFICICSQSHTTQHAHPAIMQQSFSPRELQISS